LGNHRKGQKAIDPLIYSRSFGEAYKGTLGNAERHIMAVGAVASPQGCLVYWALPVTRPLLEKIHSIVECSNLLNQMLATLYENRRFESAIVHFYLLLNDRFAVVATARRGRNVDAELGCQDRSRRRLAGVFYVPGSSSAAPLMSPCPNDRNHEVRGGPVLLTPLQLMAH
jgi:hypothetical protein